MRPFPEDYELLGFFEVEPKVLDPEIPWAYNELFFTSTAPNGVLETKMESGHEVIEFKWFQNGNLSLHLNLVGVSKIEIGNSSTVIEPNTLVATFRNSDLEKLIVRIRPFISFKWGYNDRR